MNKQLVGIVLGVVLLSGIAGYLGGQINKIKPLGGTSYDVQNFNGNVNSNGTFTANGAAVFNGAVSGITTSSLTTQTVTNLTATNATSTKLVNTTFTNSGIATMATTSVRSFCVYNGTEFTKISFSAGSTTPAYATSTSCN